MSVISNPRILACKEQTVAPSGQLVECGRTPGHTGNHMTSSASYRWAPPLQVLDGDDEGADMHPIPALELVFSR